MNKIAVIGCGGAGKSTFSRKLAERLDISVYHLYVLYWKSGLVTTPKDEWDDIVKKFVTKQEWIIDGIYRILKRRFMYHGKSRPDMNEGC